VGVENRPLPLTRPMAYTPACRPTTVQDVISQLQAHSAYSESVSWAAWRKGEARRNFGCGFLWGDGNEL